MPAPFQPFQRYTSAEEARPLLEALAARGIEAQTSLDTGQLAFDPTVVGQQFLTTLLVRLHPADFEAARQVQELVNEQQLRSPPPDHYLYGFGDAELVDILARPDEWSSLDVTLARLLLQQRGHGLAPATLRQLRQRRAQELAQPDESHPGWIKAGYLLALLGGLLGLLIGAHLYFHRRGLPDGRSAPAYSPAERRHGLRMLVLASVVFGALLWFQLFS